MVYYEQWGTFSVRYFKEALIERPVYINHGKRKMLKKTE
jgi:hypothetical protein